jgi:kynurenine formamidase
MFAPERLVDLTQPFGHETTLWPGSRPYRATTTATIAADGYFARDLDIPEHAGTHLDAPSHFVDGGAHAADIPLERLVRPVVVVDVADHVGDDASFTMGADLLRAAEMRDGPIPAGSAVLIRTGWDRHIGDPARYLGSPGPACPGIGVDAAELLVERGVVGIGIDTLGIDPGHLIDCPARRVGDRRRDGARGRFRGSCAGGGDCAATRGRSPGRSVAGLIDALSQVGCSPGRTESTICVAKTVRSGSPLRNMR